LLSYATKLLFDVLTSALGLDGYVRKRVIDIPKCLNNASTFRCEGSSICSSRDCGALSFCCRILHYLINVKINGGSSSIVPVFLLDFCFEHFGGGNSCFPHGLSVILFRVTVQFALSTTFMIAKRGLPEAKDNLKVSKMARFFLHIV
jgi:hypothetical protein